MRDESKNTPPSVCDVLQRALEIISDTGKYTSRDQWALNADNKPCGVTSERAARWNLQGSIKRAGYELDADASTVDAARDAERECHRVLGGGREHEAAVERLRVALAARRSPEGLLAMGVAAEIAKCVYEAENVLRWFRIEANTACRNAGVPCRYLDEAHEAAQSLVALALGQARKAALGAEVDS